MKHLGQEVRGMHNQAVFVKVWSFQLPSQLKLYKVLLTIRGDKVVVLRCLLLPLVGEGLVIMDKSPWP